MNIGLQKFAVLWQAGLEQPGARRKLGIVAVVSVAAFVAAMLVHAFQQPLLGDWAYVATMAKNVALGQGWVSSVYGEPRHFDPEITTGPGFLIFLAMGIALLGNATWVALLVPLLVNLSLVAVISWRLYRHLPRVVWLWSLFFLSWVFACIKPEMWVAPLGDLPAALYGVLAAILVHEGLEERRWWRLCMAGVLAGLAVLTKTMALMPLLGLLCVPLLYGLIPGGRVDGKAAFASVLILLVGSSLVGAAWWWYQAEVWSSLSWGERQLHAHDSARLLRVGGSGWDAVVQAWQNDRLFEYLSHRVTLNSQRFYRETSGLLWPLSAFFPALLLALLAAAVMATRRFRQPQGRLLWALLLPASAHLVWLLLLSNGAFGRHLYLGLSMAWFPLAIMLSRHAFPAMLVTGYLVLVAVLVPATHPVTGALYRFPPGVVLKEPLSELMHVIDALPEGVVVSGCGYYQPHEIEYHARQAGRVVDCLYRLGQVVDFDHEAFMARYPFLREEGVHDRHTALAAFFQDKQIFGTRHLVAPVIWRGETDLVLVDYPLMRLLANPVKEQAYDRLLSYCRESLFDNGHYRLQRCRAEDVRRYVDDLGGVYLPPPQWRQAWLASAVASGR